MPYARKALGAAFAAALMGLASPAAAMTETTTPDLAALDAIVSSGVMEKVYPGAVLVVGRPGRILWAKAHGSFTYDGGSTATALNSVFDLASMSKVVGTATAAMLLLDDGVIGLDDPVSKYIPGFEEGGKTSATVRHLLTHTSGLKAYESFTTVEKGRKPEESKADALIRQYASLEARADPGTTVIYSCLNAQTLARVVENASGRRLEDLLKERVYGPLGMADTVYNLSPEQFERTLPTQQEKEGGMVRGRVHDPIANYHGSAEHCPGNAGVFSTAVDVARYCEMILQGGTMNGRVIIKPETVRAMTAVQTAPDITNLRGLGWDIYRKPPHATPLNAVDGVRVVGHTGYTGTLMVVDQRSKTYLVFLTNRTWPDDTSKKRGERSIADVRRDVVRAVMSLTPEYREHLDGESD